MILPAPLPFLIVGYLVTVAIELPILLVCLRLKHTFFEKVRYAFILTAVTYPAVVLIFPTLFQLAGIESRALFLLVAESFAIFGEVFYFRSLRRKPLFAAVDRDAMAIVVANLVSFIAGEFFLSDMIREMLEPEEETTTAMLQCISSFFA